MPWRRVWSGFGVVAGDAVSLLAARCPDIERLMAAIAKVKAGAFDAVGCKRR